MKTKFLFFAMIVLPSLSQHSLQAQVPVFSKGHVSFSAGYGLVSMWMLTRDFTIEDVSVAPGITPSTLGPFYGKFEVGVGKHLGLGINYAYASNQWQYDVTSQPYGPETITCHYNKTRITWSILARMNIHVGPFRKWDPYTGFGVGYRDNHVKYTSDNINEKSGISYRTPFHVGLEFGVGCRYYFTPWFAAYAELGMQKSVFQGGITFTVPNKHP